MEYYQCFFIKDLYPQHHLKNLKNLSNVLLTGGAGGLRMLAVQRVEEAACWCCSGACGSEEWGRLHLWPWSVDKKKKTTERQKGWGCTTGEKNYSFIGEKSGRLIRLNMECNLFLRNKPSLRWCDRSVSLFKGKIWLIFWVLFLTVDTHICNDADCGLEKNRRDCSLPFRIPCLQSFRQNITRGHSYRR